MGLFNSLKNAAKSFGRQVKSAGKTLRNWLTEEVPMTDLEISTERMNKAWNDIHPNDLTRYKNRIKDAYYNLAYPSSANEAIAPIRYSTEPVIGSQKFKDGLSISDRISNTISDIKSKIKGTPSSSNTLRRGGAEPGKFKSLLGDSPTNWSREVQGLGPEHYEISHKDIDILFAQQDADKAAAKELQERLVRQSPAEKNVTRNRVSEIQKQAALEKEQAAKTAEDLKVFDSMSAEEQATVAAQYGYEGDTAGYRNHIAQGSQNTSQPLDSEGTSATVKQGGKTKLKSNHRILTPEQVKQAKINKLDKGFHAKVVNRQMQSGFSEKIATNAGFKNQDSQFAKHAMYAIGGLTAGVGITYALTRNRGQQSNAQLYGQQPLY